MRRTLAFAVESLPSFRVGPDPPMPENVALLLTDVVDSTRLADRLGDAAMDAVWKEHDGLARALLAKWGGQEIDRSDGFLMRFDRVEDAVRCALALQRATSGMREPLRMRAGIHVGPVHVRPNSPADRSIGAKAFDIGGLSIAIASRVMSIAGAGQTLITADARNVLGATAHRLQSHGHWRLKGIQDAVELHEIGDSDAPFTSPPDALKAYRVVRRNDLWIPRRDVRHSLPAERNAFVGRADVLARLGERLRGGARLISLLGPGGTGKTRLIQRFGWQWLGDFEGGVWFCDLSQALTLDGLLSAVAQGLGVPLGTAPPIEQLAAAIAGRGECLVIFDNFEQIVDCAQDTIGRWLDQAPEARFVVTTRSVLNVDGEELLSLSQLTPAESVALFLDRARAARGGFRLSSSDRPHLDTLVSMLDGLPLAIELAAARIRIMTIDTLVERMTQRFWLLASGGGRTGRHATLRATLDWSWDLLAGTEKAALAKVSVFEGGFNLAGFEAVVRSNDRDFDLLQSLVDKSWVQQSSESRFALLQSVQHYAHEKLLAMTPPENEPEPATLARRAHWTYHARRSASQAIEAGPADLDNFIHACRRATIAGDAPAAAATLENAWRVLNLCGPFQAIRPLAEGVGSMPNLPDADRALVAFVTGSASLIYGDLTEAEGQFVTGLALARAANHPMRVVLLLCQLGELYVATGRFAAAQASVTEAASIAERGASAELRCVVQNALGNFHHAAGALEEAHRAYGQALETARASHDPRWEGGLLGNLGAVASELGHLEEARNHYESALALVRRSGERRWEGNTRCNLGLLYSDLSLPGEARLQLDAALSSARHLGQRKLECIVLLNLGILAEAESDVSEARRLYGEALAIALAINDLRCQGQCHAAMGLVQVRLGDHEASARTLADARDALTGVSDLWSLAVLECRFAEIAATLERVDEARSAMTRAREIIETLQATPDSPLGHAHARAVALLDGPSIASAARAS